MSRSKEGIDQLTHEIIGCAMQVHRTLGNGFQEVIYQRALAIEFQYHNIDFQWEMYMGLTYRGYDIGKRRVIFLLKIV